MKDMNIEVQYETVRDGRTCVRLGTLTTEHPISNGQALLIDEEGDPCGPSDVTMLSDFPDDGKIYEYLSAASAAGYPIPER